jgi:RNA polymerase sigma-70 factor, ECF subfamily
MYSPGDGMDVAASECDAETVGWAGMLGRVIAAGWSRWPGVDVDLDGFEDWLRARDVDLTCCHGADLYLACALEQRDPVAIRTFDRELGPEIAGSARAAGADPATAAEVRQQVTTDVLVGDQDGPGITQFRGRGDLRGWLRSIAVRMTWRLLERARRDVVLDDDATAGIVDDPELAHLRERYACALEQAITEAMAALSPRQRTLLRLAYVDGLTVDVLGRMYAVHRATAARWLAAAREALVEDTRVRLHDAVGAGMTSVVRLVRSHIQLNLARLPT